MGLIKSHAAQTIEEKNGKPTVCGVVFQSKGVPVGDFRKAWATACKKAGLSRRLFHDLHRTASRNLIAAGVPQAVAMKITATGQIRCSDDVPLLGHLRLDEPDNDHDDGATDSAASNAGKNRGQVERTRRPSASAT